jgi:DNA polymerase-3 subunit beta
VGSAEEELPCELDGTPLTIAFNPSYLLDALGALHTSRALLTFTTPNRPALMRPVPPPTAEQEKDSTDESGTTSAVGAEAAGSGYLHLLMPVRLPG